VLKAIHKEQTPVTAHALLLRLGVWDRFFNPYPARAGIPVDSPAFELPALPDEERRDLTHLATYAIDDEGNQDPDDALSLDGERLWVHVADVAALVTPGSRADLEARGRSGTLYLPELTATMLPDEATRRLGLGLQEVSPALSFGLDLNAEGGIDGVEVVPSWIKAQRLSYQVVDGRLDEAPFAAMRDVTERFRARRHAQGAISLNFPEVDVKVHDGQVMIEPQPRLRSRRLVSEAMLMAGEALAFYADEHGIPFPYATQAVAEDVERSPEGMAQMMAVRRKLRPRRYQGAIGPHEGLGLLGYAQITSPLRRYLDLVAHQQLRAHLKGEPVMDEETLVERIGATDAVAPLLRKTERFSRRHWTLVWLDAQKDWRGDGVLMEQRKRSGLLSIPELALEVRVTLKQDVAPDSVLPLLFGGIDLPELEAHFRLPK
jgi:exoribonuclease-2